MKTDQELMDRLNRLKNSVQNLWNQLSENDLELARKKIADASDVVKSKVSDKNDKKETNPKTRSNYPLQNEEQSQTESRFDAAYDEDENLGEQTGEEGRHPKGVDFVEPEPAFDPDEQDDHQSFRDRNQNSDLSKRFYTSGLDIDEKDLKSRRWRRPNGEKDVH